MTESRQSLPVRAWVVTLSGTAVNLCLGILYAWSVWKASLVGNADHPAGEAMTGLNEGWTYLTPDEGTWAYAVCGFVFALFMIPGGRIQDRFGPKVGATAGGLFLAAGCILAGLMKSYLGLILGFGLCGGIGMGLGYAAATPAAVKWFGPHQRGFVVGIVVAGYGGASIYISFLADYLITTYGISGSFISLGILFAVVVVIAGQLLSWPEAGYIPPLPPIAAKKKILAVSPTLTRTDWKASAMLRTVQFYALVFLFMGSAQSGILVIGNAMPILKRTALAISFIAANAWLLPSFGGLVNATGRIGTGAYSDRIGRMNAYTINGLAAVVCLLAMPSIMQAGNVALLFVAIGIVYWQYGGGLSLLPALTADFFGSKNLGFNYGLVFIGWGFAFFVPQIAAYIERLTGSLNNAFYLSGALLLIAVILSRVVRRPLAMEESA